MLRFFIFFHVAGYFIVYGILTHDIRDHSTDNRSGRKPNHKNSSWQALLRDATFQSLIKHTGFTPSLDVKIETDRLLWEKIQAAKFLRKQGKTEDVDNIKTGVLVDMTPESGQLEFRQSDRSVYNCPEGRCKPIFNRLLAVWKIQKFEPHNIWVRIKIPKSNPTEDVYEYTPKLGLKQLNMAESYLSTKTKTHNKHNVWKGGENVQIVSPNEKTDEETSQTREAGIKRIDQLYDIQAFMRQLIPNQSNNPKPKSIIFPTHQPAITHYVPHIIGLTVPPRPIPKLPNYNWKEGGTYYQVEPIGILSEFQKNENAYDGFMPSTGPTGTPKLYPSTLMQPVTFPDVYPTYIAPQFDSTKRLPPTTPLNFKPSIQLVHYSELDPFYHPDEGDKFITITTTKPIADNPNKINMFPTSINEQLAALDKKKKIKETKNSTDENFNTHPTASSINVLQVTEKDGKTVFSVNDLSKIPSAITAPKIQNKTSIRKNLQSKVSSAETYDYAPMYFKWGDKIKSSANKTKLNTTEKVVNLKSQKSITVPNSKPSGVEANNKTLNSSTTSVTDTTRNNTFIANSTFHNNFNQSAQNSFNSYLKLNNFEIAALNNRTLNLKDTTNSTFDSVEVSTNQESKMEIMRKTPSTEIPPIQDLVKQRKSNKSKTKPLRTQSIARVELAHRNVVIANINNKTPEEVVNTLTNIGVHNSSRVEGYPEISEEVLESSNRLVDKLNENDQFSESTDPISIIINRISQSYSSKTSNGEVRHIKRLLDKDSS